MKKSVLCFIPAKKKSTALKNKNLKKIKNKSLTEITVTLAKKSKLFNKIVLSSDSKLILNIGKKYKIETHLRPKNISNNTARTEEALYYSLKKIDPLPDYIIILQVTSPLRQMVSLKNFYNICVKKNYDTCLSVSKLDSQISKLKKKFISLDKLAVRRRQDRMPYIYENSLFYFVKTKYFLKNKKIYSKNWNYFITDKYESIDINDKTDFNVCKKLY